MNKPTKPQRKVRPGDVLLYKQKSNVFYFFATNSVLELSVISDKVLRFRYSQDGDFNLDFSYATLNTDLPPLGFLNIEETDKNYIIYTFFLHCFVSKETLAITIYNNRGDIILDDNGGYIFQENKDHGGYNVFCKKKIQPNEMFYGLGDKPTELNLKYKRFMNWCSDTPAYQKDQDPIYRAIPFYLGLQNGLGYGVFFDNTFKTYFDFGVNEAETLTFWAEGGEMNYFFIYGPELAEVTQHYTCLTGKPNMPPLWSLGFQQSKWSYYPESVVREIAKRFRDEKIPCDAIYLDIDYMDKYKCFTWSPEHFPNPEELISDLKKDGFKTVVIVDPGIKKEAGYSVYEDGKAGDYFCRRPDGPLLENTVWPGRCHFPDFTDPATRIWWGRLYKGFVDQGIDGFWNDMNEPAVFEGGTFPLDVRHVYEGLLCSHRKAHNVYGMLMARASAEGVRSLQPNKRKLIISRAGYSGIQRYAAVWTGDNMSTWEHLLLANIQCQRLAISGVSFCGSDIGGFIGKADPELFARWIQLSVFQPFMRAHATSEYGNKEPWVFEDDIKRNIKSFIELRYKLLPYIYSAFWKYAHQGIPMLKGLVFLDQKDPETWYRQEEFALGDNILVCPISKEGDMGRYLYLPKGWWYNYFTDKPYKGKREHWIDTSIDHTPMFVKAGAVVPHWPVQQYVNELEITELILHIYYNTGLEIVKSEIYEDDYETYNYENQAYLLRNFETNNQGNTFSVKQTQTGNYESKYTSFKVYLHGFPEIDYIKSDDDEVSFNDQETVIECSLAEKFFHIQVELL